MSLYQLFWIFEEVTADYSFPDFRSQFPAPRSRFSDILLVRIFRSSTLTESLAKAKDSQDCLFPGIYIGSITDWLEKSNLSTESFIVNCKTNLRLIIVRKK